MIGLVKFEEKVMLTCLACFNCFALIFLGKYFSDGHLNKTPPVSFCQSPQNLAVVLNRFRSFFQSKIRNFSGVSCVI